MAIVAAAMLLFIHRRPFENPMHTLPTNTSISIVGRGRLGIALAEALSHAGVSVRGPFARGEAIHPADAIVLAVPEREIAATLVLAPPNALVGHCSASFPLDALAPHERFNCHPLMTLNHSGVAARALAFRGAACAVDGSTNRAKTFAMQMAATLGMRSVHVDVAHRPLYHASASIASNFLVTLEDAAEQLGNLAGITRQDLAPLVRASVDAWIAGGFAHAISGPISRRDHETVAQQRIAVEQSAPELLALFDVLSERTRERL